MIRQLAVRNAEAERLFRVSSSDPWARRANTTCPPLATQRPRMQSAHRVTNTLQMIITHS